jgi:hypothetical protein
MPEIEPLLSMDTMFYNSSNIPCIHLHVERGKINTNLLVYVIELGCFPLRERGLATAIAAANYLQEGR